MSEQPEVGPAAIIAGFDWGARPANVVAALRPGRCQAMVSVSGLCPSHRRRRRLLTGEDHAAGRERPGRASAQEGLS
jgi:pimeloyl-ACP methyl ester carboxylesterase